MPIAVLWNGPSCEAIRFVDAVNHHCECQQLKRRCPAHELMLSQFVLDHLLFERWLHLRNDPLMVTLVDG